MDPLIMAIRRNRRLLIVPVFLIIFLILYSMQGGPHPDPIGDPIYATQRIYWKYRNEKKYRIAMVADMDKQAKIEDKKWRSYLQFATLTRDASGRYTVAFDNLVSLYSNYNDGARGMELSDLCYFEDKFYTFDDRTGIVYLVLIPEGGIMDVDSISLIPYAVMSDGDGMKAKGFKGEWCTVKDDQLYIGGMGKEWTSPKGIIENVDPMYVKTIDRSGKLSHHNWVSNYKKLNEATGTTAPGYLLHEAVTFNQKTRKWVFLPRRVSKLIYDEELDEERCGNVLITADENFNEVKAQQNFGPLDKLRGFSSVKAIPYRENEYVVLKSKEKYEVETFISVIRADGVVLMDEIRISGDKYEGIEFV